MDLDPRDYDSRDEERLADEGARVGVDAQERDRDPGDVFARDLNLSRRLEREIVHNRDRAR